MPSESQLLQKALRRLLQQVSWWQGPVRSSLWTGTAANREEPSPARRLAAPARRDRSPGRREPDRPVSTQLTESPQLTTSVTTHGDNETMTIIDQVHVDQVHVVDQVDIDQVHVDQVHVDIDQVHVDQVDVVDQVDIDQVDIDQVDVDQVDIDQVDVDQVDIDQVRVDQVHDGDSMFCRYSFTLKVGIVSSRQWCAMSPCLDDEGCDLLVSQSGWTCTQPGGRVKTTTEGLKQHIPTPGSLGCEERLGLLTAVTRTDAPQRNNGSHHPSFTAERSMRRCVRPEQQQQDVNIKAVADFPKNQLPTKSELFFDVLPPLLDECDLHPEVMDVAVIWGGGGMGSRWTLAGTLSRYVDRKPPPPPPLSPRDSAAGVSPTRGKDNQPALHMPTPQPSGLSESHCTAVLTGHLSLFKTAAVMVASAPFGAATAGGEGAGRLAGTCGGPDGAKWCQSCIRSPCERKGLNATPQRRREQELRKKLLRLAAAQPRYQQRPAR
ncbi:hypothetical protein PAMP_020308 [Pampus punctatissimus]